MAKTFSFRISLENYDELKRSLEALGPAGDAALQKINQAAPQLRDNLRQAREEADKHATAMKAVGKAHGDAASGMMPLNMRMMELGHSARASADALAAGMSPTRVMAMEGARLAQAFGLMGAILNPVTLGIVAAGGAMAVIAARMASLSAETRGYQVLLNGMGMAAGNSAIQMQSLARSMELSGMGRGDSEAAITAMVRARTLPTSMFGSVAQLGLDASGVTGEAPVKQVEAFTKALTGGYAGIVKLDDEFNVLTEAERQSIRVMADHGNQVGMMETAVGALERRFHGLHEQGLSETDKAFHEIAVAYNDLVDTIAKSPITITVAKGALDEIKGMLTGGDSTLANIMKWVPGGSLASAAMSIPGAVKSVTGSLEYQALTGARAKWEPAGPWEAQPPADASFDIPKPSPADQARASSTKKVNDQLADLAEKHTVDSLRGVDKAVAEGALRAREYVRSHSIVGEDNVARVTEAFKDDARKAWEVSHVNRTDRVGLNAAGAIAEAGAYLSSPAAGDSAAAARKGGLDALKSATDAARQSQDELNLAQAEALITGAKHVNELEREATAQKAVADAARQGAAALREAKLAASIDKSTEAQRAVLANDNASPEAKRIAQAEIDRTGGAMRDLDFQKLRESMNADLAARQLAMEKAQEKQGLIGLSSSDLATRSAQLDFKYQLKGQGLQGDQLDSAYNEGADMVGRAAQAGQAVTEYEDRLKQAKASAADFSRVIAGGFEDAIMKGKDFKSVLLSVSQDLEKIAMRMLVTKPMENMMTGMMGSIMPGMSGGGGFGAGAGLLGSLFPSLFGGGAAQGPSGFGSPLDAASGGGMLSGIGSWFSGLFGGFATGGQMDTGRAYAVNENSTAPGLFLPLAPGRIDPTPTMGSTTQQGMQPGGGHTVVINMNGVQGDPATIRRSATQAAAMAHRSISAANQRVA